VMPPLTSVYLLHSTVPYTHPFILAHSLRVQFERILSCSLSQAEVAAQTKREEQVKVAAAAVAAEAPPPKKVFYMLSQS